MRLTTDMLDQLSCAWRKQKAPIADDLRPGLTGDELDALGLDLLYLPLSSATDLYRGQLSIAARVADPPGLTAEEVWPPSWFPISSMGDGAMMICDCAVPDGAPTPIRYFDHEFRGRAEDPVASSLGTVVSWWLAALESGAWAYQPEAKAWREHPELLPNRDLGAPDSFEKRVRRHLHSARSWTGRGPRP